MDFSGNADDFLNQISVSEGAALSLSLCWAVSNPQGQVMIRSELFAACWQMYCPLLPGLAGASMTRFTELFVLYGFYELGILLPGGLGHTSISLNIGKLTQKK